MNSKQIGDLQLFISGNASQPIPSKAMMTYTLIKGEARKLSKVFELSDLDPKITAQDLWAYCVKGIVEREGINEEVSNVSTN